MPGFPTYDERRVAPQGQGGFSIAVPSTEAFDEPARQVDRMAQATGQAGARLGDIALKAADEANQTHVMDAANQAREAALHLAYDPQEGYARVKGGDVLPRDGNPLAVDYTAKFDDQLKSISGTLANDAQRRAFAQQAGQLRASFE